MEESKKNQMKIISQNDKIIGLLQNRATTPTPPREPTTATRRWELDPTGYCWTHGFKVAKGHTSSKCRYKNGGHVDTADRKNIRGGSVRDKPDDWTGKNTA